MGKIKFELLQEADSPKFRTAIEWCKKNGLKVERKSPHQLKVGPFNLYPDAGSWNSDLDPRRKLGGIDAFQSAVLRWVAENPSTGKNPPPLRSR